MTDPGNTKLNYIHLINRFWELDEEIGFSHLETRLYFKLCEINNRLKWKETFQYANSRLESAVGTRQKNLIFARQKLINNGLISYQKGNTRNAGTYSLFPELLSIKPTKESKQGSNKKVIKGTLIKQDYKQDNTKTLAPENFQLFRDVIQHFESKFYKEKSWLECYDKLIRIDKYSEQEILSVVKHFRQEGNWWKDQGNFESLLKLRKTNNEGIKHIDLFSTKIKNSQNGKSEAVNEGDLNSSSGYD